MNRHSFLAKGSIMGKSVTVKSGFVDVPLPQAGNANKPYSQGQTATLTDAEYAALPASVTRALTLNGTVAEPNRPSTDPNARTTNVNDTATGAVALKSGSNRLKLVGNISPTFPTGATSGTEMSVDLVAIQDGTGSRTLTLPASAKKPGATAATLTTTANAVDYLRFITVDGGVTWLLVNKQLDIR